jgi:hypothetical protein
MPDSPAAKPEGAPAGIERAPVQGAGVKFDVQGLRPGRER